MARAFGDDARSESIRTLRARLGAHALHAKHDPRETTAAARRAFLSKFERQVVQDAAARGEALTDAEIERRATHARKAHFTRLALRSAMARRKP
jgi:hypothetical protein